MKNILFFVCAAVVTLSFFGFGAAVFGGPVLLAYNLITVSQWLVTILVLLFVGAMASSLVFKLDLA